MIKGFYEKILTYSLFILLIILVGCTPADTNQPERSPMKLTASPIPFPTEDIIAPTLEPTVEIETSVPTPEPTLVPVPEYEISSIDEDLIPAGQNIEFKEGGYEATGRSEDISDITIVKSLAELKAVYGRDTGSNNFSSKYSDDFFKENALLIYSCTIDGGGTPQVQYLKKNNNVLYMYYSLAEFDPSSGVVKPDVLYPARVLVEVKKSDIQNITKLVLADVILWQGIANSPYNQYSYEDFEALEIYDNSILINLKGRYLTRQFTVADFPGIDIEELKINTYNGYIRSFKIILKNPSKRNVLDALRVLETNEYVFQAVPERFYYI